MRIEELRLINVTTLIKEKYGNKKASFAAAIKKDATYVSRWYSKTPKNKRNISSETAREIEQHCELPVGWLDTDHSPKMVAEHIRPYNAEGTNLAGAGFDVNTRQNNQLMLRSVPVLHKEDILSDTKPSEYGSARNHRFVEAKNTSEQTFAMRCEHLPTDNDRHGHDKSATIIVDPERKPENGHLVLVKDSNNNLMVKRYESVGSKVYLAFEDSKYDPIQLTNDFTIIGVLVGSFTDYLEYL